MKSFTAASAAHLFTDLQTPGWAFDVELLMRARLSSYLITEIPVRLVQRDGSRVSLLDYLKTLVDILQMRRKIRS